MSNQNIQTEEKWWEQERNRFLSFISILEEKVKELEANIDDPEWCCTKHKAWLIDQAEEAESCLEAERKSVDELSLALQQSESRIKELQEERDGYKNGQIQLQGMVDDLMDVNSKWAKRVERLEEAIDRHEIFKRAHERVVALEDEALYQTRKEV